MKNKKDGLSREERKKHLPMHGSFTMIDNGKASLFKQSLKIAGFLRYYNLDHQPDGYFNDLLTDFKDADKLLSDTADRPAIVEPSQALLLIFLENLKKTTEQFNERWKAYPQWYINEILKIKPLPLQANKVWIAFEKKPLEKVIVPQGTRFLTVNQDKRPLYFKLNETIQLSDISIEEAYMLSLEKDNRKYPELLFDFVTGIKLKEIFNNKKKPITTSKLKTVGIKLTSPALLLREGTRTVTITFYSELKWEAIFESKKKEFYQVYPELEHYNDEEQIKHFFSLFTKNIFYLNISTTEGWKNISTYSVSINEDGLDLTFTLAESFPATMGCTIEKHQFYSKYPCLKVHLNFDAWLYAYSWIKYLLLYKVRIKNKVRGVNHIQVYNQLGQVDISKPFAPFGIKNEKGAWLAIGNYEMAIKQTNTIDLEIQWHQLPDSKKGLQEYYAQYNKNIHNSSFKFQSRFLADYNWKETPGRSTYYLFNSLGNLPGKRPAPDQPLLPISLLERINISNMTPVSIDEKDYNYTTKSRFGFINLTLISPDIGFGEQEYRKLFTEQLLNNTKKDRKYPSINEPINPMIDRITLNYRAEDLIYFNETGNRDSAIDSILPIDTLTTFPDENKAIPFAVDMEESNLLLALKNVTANSLLNVYFEFIPSHEEVAARNIPQIQWYIGHMRNWKAMSHSFVRKDETRRLSVDGRIQFSMPENIAASLFDNDGLLWLRAGFVMTEKVVIPKIKHISTNAAQLILDIDFGETEKIPFKQIITPLELEKSIPGVTAFRKISPFYEGREAEDQKDILTRVSRYITHQGRAVIPRDYERMTLQAFPDIAKVKCYRDNELNKNGKVYLAVLPFKNDSKPLVSNSLMLKIEHYLSSFSSAYVTDIKVTNPVYQEILVRAVLQFNGAYFSEASRKLMIQNINDVIAPWQSKREIPVFNYSIEVDKLRAAILEEFKMEVVIIDLEVLRFEKDHDQYLIHEYLEGNETIIPPKPNVIFVPAKEHIIHVEGIDLHIIKDFGIDEMTLEDTFIIK